MENSSFPRFLSAGLQVGDTMPTTVLSSDSRRTAKPSQGSGGRVQCVETSEQPGPSITERVMSLPLIVGAAVVGK